MTTRSVDLELHGRFVRAYDALQSTMRRAEPTRGQAADIPRTWRRSLLVIDDRPGLSPSALAAALGVTPAAVSPAMRELNDRGLIERTTDPRDGRSVQLRIAPGGRELVSELWQTVNDVVDELFEPLTEAERLQLVELLERGVGIQPL